MMATPVVWAVVPAAGIGARMQSTIPKQYLALDGSTVLALTLQRLLTLTQVQRVVIVLDSRELDSPTHSRAIPEHDRLVRCAGASDRHGSVLNALAFLEADAADEDWVLVHDAVRPCVRGADMERLLSAVAQHACGGLLAAPVRDTLKRSDAGEPPGVTQTLDRTDVWSAFTPQVFRYRALRDALQQAARQGNAVTDESSAMEAAGYTPLLVRGSADNIKITHPEDLPLAAAILAAQRSP